jgi:hypothetical protein
MPITILTGFFLILATHRRSQRQERPNFPLIGLGGLRLRLLAINGPAFEAPATAHSLSFETRSHRSYRVWDRDRREPHDNLQRKRPTPRMTEERNSCHAFAIEHRGAAGSILSFSFPQPA